MASPLRTGITTANHYASAVFGGPDDCYRYALTRTWDVALAPVSFLMLNPSTADHLTDDKTISMCCGFARRWGYGGINVVNLYAYRTTFPAVLWERWRGDTDIVGPHNEQYIKEYVGATDRLVCAWGVAADRVQAWANTVLRRCVPPHVERVCLGTTQGGFPRHPSRLGYNAEVQPYE